jgi:uncharacterized protein with HEPN domain
VSRTDEELVRDALDHLDTLRHHLTMGSFEDPLISDAVNMRLSAAIETISQTSSDFRGSYFSDDWQYIKALRNRISHGYSFLDNDVIKATIEKDLPGFEAQLRRAVTEF